MSLLDLVNLVLTLSFPRPWDSIPTWAYLDLVNLVLSWSSSGSCNSGNLLGITWTWRICSPTGRYLVLVTLFPTWT